MHRSAIKVMAVKRLLALCTAGSMALSATAVAQAGRAEESEGDATQTPPTVTLERDRIEAPDLTTPTTEAHYFSDVDYSNDHRLSWDEMITFYETEIREGGWTLTEFFDEFDTDGDEFLDEEEYAEFLSEVGLEEPQNRSSFMDIDELPVLKWPSHHGRISYMKTHPQSLSKCHSTLPLMISG